MKKKLNIFLGIKMIPFVLFIFLSTHLFSQNEFQYLFLYKKQNVKEEIWWGMDIDSYPTFEYLDSKIIKHHAAQGYMFPFILDTFFISKHQKIDSIYHVVSDIEYMDCLYKKTYFYYDHNQLTREESFEDTIHIIKKYMYNESHFLDSLIAIKNNGKNAIQYIFKYECDEKGRIIQKELIQGQHEIKKENYSYNKKGILKNKTTIYSQKMIASSNSKDIQGEYTIIYYEYKYNKKGLIKIEYEDWNNYDPDGKVTEKGFKFAKEFVYKYYK